MSLSKREPIGRVIDDPSTPPALRAKLQEVTEIRDFASRDLSLPDNGSYRSYADVGRPYVVWNVVAAPEFSLNPRRWCYPIVGCVAYRGYFHETKARSYAAKLRGEGLDVSVGGVAAYSTLGHFSDPILNTMMGWDDVELASIVFHELTHQLLYARNDSSFNEALATTVEEEGVRRWLLHQGRDQDLARHVQERERWRAGLALIAMNKHRAFGDLPVNEFQKRFEAGHHEKWLRWIDQIEIEMVAALQHEIVGVVTRNGSCRVPDGTAVARLFAGVDNCDGAVSDVGTGTLIAEREPFID